jgi:hypothetical protein
MRAARHKGDLMLVTREQPAEIAADPAGSDDGDLHSVLKAKNCEPA